MSGNNKLITRYGVIQPVQSKFDSIFDTILKKDSIDLLRNHSALKLAAMLRWKVAGANGWFQNYFKAETSQLYR